ncbi:MAG: TauD/TfdA family dioxygenase [Sphingomonadales bacterium]|nr:TauD/TfdA family dioxygenase [Sphingomonadales bacterium]
MAIAAREKLATLAITPLTGSIGARIDGADLSRDLAPPIAAEIRRAFAQYSVLVFRRDGEATPEEQHRLAALFGEPQPLQVFQFLGAPQASITFEPGSRIAAADTATAPKQSAPIHRKDLQGLGIAGEFDGWHSDSSFCHFLPKAAVLRAEVIAPVGGDTGFASLCAAYDALSPMMQGWLEDLRAVHIVPDGFKEGIALCNYGADAEERFDAFFPPKEWPLVVRHPETGRKALWINPGYVAHIVGLKRAESHALIRFLAHHVASASFTYRHHWQPGDLVVWDEVFALHRAPDDFAPHPRKVVRVTAGRQVPTK